MAQLGPKVGFGEAWARSGGGALWAALAGLEVRVEELELRGLEQPTASGFTRLTTEFQLAGAGLRGRGEDIHYDAGDQRALRAAGPPEWLRGRWTLGELDARLSAPGAPPLGPPVPPAGARARRWAVESAALDLALQQVGQTLGEALGLEARPVRYVVSMGLGTPPTLQRLEALREACPALRFKLDAGPLWTDALVARLFALECVDVVDLKGCYEWTAPLPDEVQQRVASGLPEALLEDPYLPAAGATPRDAGAGAWARLAAHRDRITWDAPLHGWGDLLEQPWPPHWINVKPSRFGSLRTLLEVYERAVAVGLRCYGGGQFELGVGRPQIQGLAALFHPDAPNDVAPVAFNAPGVPRGVPAGPLAAGGLDVGFH